MRVNVKFFGLLRLDLGRWGDELTVSDGSTVWEVLEALVEKNGEVFRNYIYDEHGQVREHITFQINGKNVKTLMGFDTALKEGDSLLILPPFGGG